MEVKEIRNAVIDTINFIVPPFAKVLVSLLVAHYITYGILTDYMVDSIGKNTTQLNLSTIKTTIDKLYLSSVIPILFILFIISMAYLIDRISNFLSSLIPIVFVSSSQLTQHYETAIIWKFFPEIVRFDDLEFKINDIITKLRIDNDPSLELLKYPLEKKDREFKYLKFVYFLISFSIICFWSTRYYLNHELNSTRLICFLFILFLFVLGIFARIAFQFFEMRSIELELVIQYLKKINFNINLTFSEDDLNKIKKDKLLSKWWWLAIDFRFSWLKMFKHYRFKIPFVSIFNKIRDWIRRCNRL